MEFVKRDDAGPKDRPIEVPKVGQVRASEAHIRSAFYGYLTYKCSGLAEEAAKDVGCFEPLSPRVKSTYFQATAECVTT